MGALVVYGCLLNALEFVHLVDELSDLGLVLFILPPQAGQLRGESRAGRLEKAVEELEGQVLS